MKTFFLLCSLVAFLSYLVFQIEDAFPLAVVAAIAWLAERIEQLETRRR